MNFLNNPANKGNAQRLRREMTKEERHLWYDFFKTAKIHANRQKPIGPYIVDFYIASAKIVIELDGGQHFEQAGQTHDENRDRFLREQGLTVLRYSNSDVNRNFNGVCEDILRHLGMDV
jgi:very-short-patch-repair endonuclease